MGYDSFNTFMPYYTPPMNFGFAGSPYVSPTKTENAEEKKRKQEEEKTKKRIEENMKKLELSILQAEYDTVTKNLKEQQEQTEKTLKQLENSKNKDGSATMDSGAGGWLRLLSNAGTSLLNIGKGIIGYEKDGSWSGEKLALNCVGIAIGIGALWIPGGAFVLGALGVIGGIAGGIKSWDDLTEAMKKKDQAKIDAAQQDLCGNIIIGTLSAVGLRGIGAGFRTSAATAEQASCAAQRTGFIGKTIEGVSNFGRDMTVNAFKASLKPRANGIVPSFSKLKNWETQYQTKLSNYENTLNKQIQAVDDLIQTTTDNQKLTLLLEQRNLLTKNRLEFNKFKTLKSKSDIDKLIAKDTQTAAQANIERLGNYSVNNNNVSMSGGYNVKAEDFIQFKKQMINLQKAYDKGLRNLVKTRENMMRTYSRDPEKYRAILDEYISTANVKKKWWNRRTVEEIAIGGNNPSYTMSTFGTLFTHPTSNIPKASGLWCDPIHSSPLLLAMDLTPEETQAQIANVNQTIEVFKALREKFNSAKSKEEFTAAINEYNQLVAASQGAPQSSETQQKSEEMEEKTA